MDCVLRSGNLGCSERELTMMSFNASSSGGTFLDLLPAASPLLINAGGPGRTRTADQQFRKLLLYPPELRGLGINYSQDINSLLNGIRFLNCRSCCPVVAHSRNAPFGMRKQGIETGGDFGTGDGRPVAPKSLATRVTTPAEISRTGGFQPEDESRFRLSPSGLLDCYFCASCEQWLAASFHALPCFTQVSVHRTVRARCSPWRVES